MKRRPILLVVAVAALQGQPAFDVTSVKPSASTDNATRINWSRGRFSAVNVTTHQFIESAYKLEPFRVTGGAGWLSANRFNIDATIPPDTVIVQTRGMPAVIQAMMRALLADRFRFTAHWEQKPRAVYALVRAKVTGDLGPNLHKTDTDCAAQFRAARSGGPPVRATECYVQRAPGKVTAGAYVMPQVADTLASLLQQVVLDHTGLSGAYDIDLSWAADPTSDSGPSLFTAVQEQLGLRLESIVAPIEVLVIDHVEKPAPD